MKIAQIILAIFTVFVISLSSFAEEYNFLVIPNSIIDTAHRTIIGKTDIEELLAKKFIDKLEASDTANAPTVNVLKISIINNPNFKYYAENPLDNAKIIANAFGISKVLIISSTTEVKNPAQQKEFWKKMGLPVITNPEPNVRVVTRVTMYNVKDDEVLYSDVFYKNLNFTGTDINVYDMGTPKLTAVNSYYEELIPKMFENVKDSKQTHAILLSSTSGVQKNIVVTDELLPKKSAKKSEEKEVKPVSTPSVPTTEVVSVKHEKIVPAKKLQPDLEVKENFNENKQDKKEKKGLLAKIKDGMKFNVKIFDYCAVKDVPAQATQTKPYTVRKSVVKKVLKERNNELKKQETAVKSVKTDEKKEIQTSDKPNKEKVSDNENKINYSNMVIPTEDNESANRYIQTKLRTRAKEFSPKFDNTVNDM